MVEDELIKTAIIENGKRSDALTFSALEERLLKQDLNPIRLISVFALPLRGKGLREVTKSYSYAN